MYLIYMRTRRNRDAIGTQSGRAGYKLSHLIIRYALTICFIQKRAVINSVQMVFGAVRTIVNEVEENYTCIVAIIGDHESLHDDSVGELGDGGRWEMGGVGRRGFSEAVHQGFRSKGSIRELML